MNDESINREEKANEENKQPDFDINKLDKNALKELASGLIAENEELQSENEELNEKLETVNRLYEKANATAAKTHDLNRLYKNLSSDFDAYKKRNANIADKAKEDAVIYAALNIIPIYDNLLRAATEFDGNDKTGIEMIVKQFEHVLESMDVKKMDVLGELFDHNYHEGITTVKAKNPKDADKIVEVITNGYMYKDKVIKHAQVIIAQ